MPKASAGRRIKPAVAKTTYDKGCSGAFHPFRAFPPTHPHELGSAWWDVAVKKASHCRRERRAWHQVSVIFSPALAWLSARAHDLAAEPGDD